MPTKQKPLKTMVDDRSQTLTSVIALASLFGSGSRDASGDTVKENFTANRGGVTISYSENSGSCYINGDISVRHNGKSVIKVERTIGGNQPDTDVITAGYMWPLSYKVINWDGPCVKPAIAAFMDGLELIGKKGDLIPIPAGVIVMLRKRK